MKYVIMADGKGTRWNNYRGIPKHLIKIGGETILARTVRLIKEVNPYSEIIITSHNPSYEVPGAKRYEPINNQLEIDRFTFELINDSTCFLYGDTFYSKDSIETIIKTPERELVFFGNMNKIFAVKVGSEEVMKRHISKVRALYIEGKISECVGWQIYQSFQKLPYGKKLIKDDFIIINDSTCDFSFPEDYMAFTIDREEAEDVNENCEARREDFVRKTV